MAVRKLHKGKYQATTHIAVVVLLMIIFVLVGYYIVVLTSAEPEPDTQALQQLQDNRRLWKERRPPAFRYIVDRECECPAEIREPYAATESGDAVTAEFPERIQAKFDDPATTPLQPMWIDDIFLMIESALQDKVAIEVAYDYNMGYPTALQISADDNPGGRAESLEVRDFETLEYER